MASMIHQDAAHQARGDGEEMGAVSPLHPPLVHEAEVRLIHQCGALQGMIPIFRRQTSPRDVT
jgi:hypothetical protein